MRTAEVKAIEVRAGGQPLRERRER